MSYKSELQANNVDLQSILDAVNNLPDAGSGENLDTELTEQETKIAELISVLEGKAAGGGGSDSAVDETLTIAQDCANAQEVYDLFVSLVPEGTVSAVFEWGGDVSTAANNQFIFGALPFTNGLDSNANTRMSYIRLRDGALATLVSTSAGYDLILKAGDSVRMTASLNKGG